MGNDGRDFLQGRGIRPLTWAAKLLELGSRLKLQQTPTSLDRNGREAEEQRART